jgi:hypothetical protein
MLKNIRFKNVQADIRGIYRISRVLIRWQLEPTAQNLKNLYFNVYRGEAETDMRQINTVPMPATGRNEFMDYTALLKDITKNYYYQVQAVELNPCNSTVLQTFKSELFDTGSDPDLVNIYIIEEHLFALQYVYGVPALIYTKKVEGFRCDCWDEVLKRVTRSNCLRCKGVGFVGGYYPPVEGWIDFAPSPEQVVIADWGEKQAQQTDIQFTDYPNLQIGDIILQLKPFNFWRVENNRTTLKNQTTILQIARLNAVNRSDIEYTLDVPNDVMDRLLAELRVRELTPEF